MTLLLAGVGTLGLIGVMSEVLSDAEVGSSGDPSLLGIAAIISAIGMAVATALGGVAKVVQAWRGKRVDEEDAA